MVFNYKIIMAYDGTNFCGFQKQAQQRTVQNEVEAVLKTINNNQFVSLQGAGRTDTKVHALNQVATFVLPYKISDIDNFKYRMNRLLPDDIYIKTITMAPDDFHARYHARGKHYQYLINMGPYNVFERNYVYQYNKVLDIKAMQAVSTAFLGRQDFRSFSSAKSTQNTIRELFNIDFKVVDQLLIVDFYGSGFLRYMVRKLMMALLEAGQHKLDDTKILNILAQKNINFYSKVAPPEGLYLVAVLYE
jgi:tRNA pseudouridine38-40 synthase